MAVVYIPLPMRAYAGGEAKLEAHGATLRALVRNLDARCPGLGERVVHPDDPDRLMPGLAAVVDGEPTNMGMLTPLAPDSEVHFLPAIAGGA